MLHELVWTAPFVALLASIAIIPLINKHFWEKSYLFISLALGILVVIHYIFQLHDTRSLIHTLYEYISFIALIGSLFVVAGGIHINVKGESTPLGNCVFLLIGAVLANFLGTTGASMILIRPWMRMNKYRLTAFHIVFFIFIVSNIGGGLTPIGDPPLFLGYLKGVPFFWVLENVIPEWLIAIGYLLAIFFIFDQINFLKAPKKIREAETAAGEEWRFDGTHNIFFLFMIIGSVFINTPLFLREAIMLAAAVLSYKTTSALVHKKNGFNFEPIKEVAILFLGIFATMIPALHWLETNASALGIESPGQFFWGCGILSAVLDNAPTYLNFLSAALGLFTGETVGEHDRIAVLLKDYSIYLKAISISAVYFGAVTYIGNGPNFLVKSIADHNKVRTPSFFGYFFKYSLPLLIPLFGIIWFLFFRA